MKPSFTLLIAALSVFAAGPAAAGPLSVGPFSVGPAAPAAGVRAVAEARPPVVQVASRIHTNALLKSIRGRLVRKQRVSFAELRLLADTGDGLAAYRLAQRIVAMEKPAILPDAAHYFSIAVYDGRAYAIRPLVKILGDPGVAISEKRLEHIERALQRQASSGELRAVEGLAHLYKSGVPFGAKPEKAQELLKAVLDKKFDGELALRLAVNIAQKKPLAPSEIAEIRKYLLIAEASDTPGTRAAAQTLLQSYPEPEASNDAG
jgi:hypothetical protein